jgi:DNA-binding GntR family transcriptional regulator
MREELLNAKWLPGTLLQEGELSELYGVSKTPIREALRLLSNEGWIDVLPRRGYLVRRLRLHDVREIFDVRLLVEPGLFARTARYLDRREVAELRRIADTKIDSNGSIDGSASTGREFHLALARMSRNERALAIVTGLLNEVRRLHQFLSDMDTHRRPELITSEHQAMVSALENRNIEGAYRLMHDHISADGRRMVEAFSRTMAGPNGKPL